LVELACFLFLFFDPRESALNVGLDNIQTPRLTSLDDHRRNTFTNFRRIVSEYKRHLVANDSSVIAMLSKRRAAHVKNIDIDEEMGLLVAAMDELQVSQ